MMTAAKRRVGWLTLLLAICLCAGLGTGIAQACDTGLSPAAQRQANALLGQMRLHGCTGRESGFFSRCGAYRQRLDAIYLASYAARCESPVKAVARSQPVRKPRSRVVAAPILPRTTFCVRLSDGYLFPSPQSGFATKLSARDLLAQCRMICETPDMDLFRVEGEERRDDTMLSLTTGEPYSSLPRAGAYRSAKTFAACNHAGFSRHVAEQQTLQDPDRRKTVPSAKAPVDFAVWTLRSRSQEFASNLPQARPVRLVGPRFFPDEPAAATVAR